MPHRPHGSRALTIPSASLTSSSRPFQSPAATTDHPAATRSCSADVSFSMTSSQRASLCAGK